MIRSGVILGIAIYLSSVPKDNSKLHVTNMPDRPSGRTRSIRANFWCSEFLIRRIRANHGADVFGTFPIARAVTISHSKRET
jgi:hypothetical protein